jgi:molybdenum cofactor synthesis domain-containing protein
MVEETAAAGDHIEMPVPTAPGRNVGRRAADIATGDLVVRAGDMLTPSRVGALAAIGRAELVAYARPRVAILSTGNEVVDPGRPLEAGQVYDVNRFTLAAIVAAHGGVPQPHKAAQDTIQSLVEALEAIGSVDLIVFSGGSSVGERDLVSDLVATRGKMVFHGIAVKPGKPTAFALVGDTPFFGMPGNPTSCLSNAYILLIPFLRAVARLPPHTPRTVRVPIGQRITSTAGRHQFYTVRLRDGAAYPAFKGSGDITSLSQADGYIEMPPEQSVVEEAAVVEVTLF